MGILEDTIIQNCVNGIQNNAKNSLDRGNDLPDKTKINRAC